MAVRIYRTAGSPTLNTKHTISLWFKRSRITFADTFLMDGYQDANNRFKLAFDSSDRLELYNTHGGSYKYNVRTNRKFRDTSAFYHLVIRIDTTQASASDRVRVYVNGTEEESFNTYTDATQNDANNVVNESGATISIGDYQGGNNAFEGLMAHFHFIDGTSYAPTTFGETDSSSGIWKPIVVPSVTYGNNGFFLKFENAGNLDLDSSGNNLSFTTSGTLTQMLDTPTKNFNTLNPNLISSGVTISNSGRSFNSGSSVNYGLAGPNFALNKGKWYFEYKIGHPCAAGFIADTYQIAERIRGNNAVGNTSEEYAWEGNGYIKTNGGQTAYGSSASANDIIGMYVDLDNNKLYIGVNGTIQNSGTGFSITDPDSLTSGFYYIGGMSDQCGATANVTADMNFGDGFFGTTAVSSAQADANGEGAFEYSPNDSGGSSFDSAAKNFYALNTKNIKEFG